MHSTGIVDCAYTAVRSRGYYRPQPHAAQRGFARARSVRRGAAGAPSWCAIDVLSGLLIRA